MGELRANLLASSHSAHSRTVLTLIIISTTGVPSYLKVTSASGWKAAASPARHTVECAVQEIQCKVIYGQICFILIIISTT